MDSYSQRSDGLSYKKKVSGSNPLESTISTVHPVDFVQLYLCTSVREPTRKEYDNSYGIVAQ